MDSATKTLVIEMTRASDEERMTFPQAVAALVAARVERYHADLMRSERVFYMPDGASERVSMHTSPPPAAAFVAQGVEAAVGAIQRGEIPYLEFCARIAQAGCVGYHVFLSGRRVIYYGRKGDQHVEYFPGAKP